MPALHLRKPGNIHTTCGSFPNYRAIIEKFKETGDLNYIFKNKLNKSCFAQGSAYCNIEF